MKTTGRKRDELVMPEHGLDVLFEKEFLSRAEEQSLFEELKSGPWYRVKYLSERHNNACETPCWTNFFGGVEGVVPYQPVPSVYQELISRLQQVTPNVQYNAVLVRLYFDGSDQITWHTDGRTFLGEQPTIASLSLGAARTFELRKMTNVWPCAGTPDGGVDKRVSPISLVCNGGDLLVMKGKTQQHWHHRVPAEKSARGPRININFRYIIPGKDETTIRGVRAFYKYMVSGDQKSADFSHMFAPSFSWSDIVKSKGPMLGFLATAEKRPAAPPQLSIAKIKKEDESPPEEEVEKGWTCSACTLHNQMLAVKCAVCEQPRSKKTPSSKKVGGSLLTFFAPQKTQEEEKKGFS